MQQLEAMAVLVLLVSSTPVVGTTEQANSTVSFEKGVDFPSWESSQYMSQASDDSLALLKATGAEWIGLQVEWYMDNVTSDTIHPDEHTATDEALVHATSAAHSLLLNVELRVITSVLDGSSKKEIDPSNWQAWFRNYRTYVLRYAELARNNNVEQIMLGAELDMIVPREAEWRALIADVRSVYRGKLTYGASHESCISAHLGSETECRPGYRDVTWWDALDLAGVDSYFQLTEKRDPTLPEMIAGWNKRIADFEQWQAGINMPVIFTEVGYASYSGSNIDPAKEMVHVKNPVVDLQEQADAYEATFRSFYGKPWFKGIFWWRWEPNPNAGGSSDWTYTPQNKPAQQVITEWYAENWDHPTITTRTIPLHISLSTAYLPTKIVPITYWWVAIVALVMVAIVWSVKKAVTRKTP